jgi:hypothetical protein
MIIAHVGHLLAGKVWSKGRLELELGGEGSQLQVGIPGKRLGKQ